MCKQDIKRHVIVLVQYKCVCARLWAFLCVCVSWSGINPCVLWTLWVSVLADIRRSVAGVLRQWGRISPLCLTGFLCSSGALQRSFLTLSTSSSSFSSHFPHCLVFCYNFRSYILSPFPHQWPPVDFLSWCRSLFIHLLFSVTLIVFFSLLYGIQARLTDRTQLLFFLSFT